MSPRKFFPIVAASLALGAVAAPAQAATPAEFVASSAAWLESQGFDVGKVTAEVRGPDYRGSTLGDDGLRYDATMVGNTASAAPGIVTFATGKSEIETLSAKFGARVKMNAREIRTARVVLHELLHQFGLRSGGWRDSALATPDDWQTAAAVRGDQRHEEGAAEAVAYDLLPKFTARMFGHKLRTSTPSAYPRELANVRQISVFGSGAGKWTKPAAVAWRADFVRASYSERRAMVAKATAVRVAWGKRTGR